MLSDKDKAEMLADSKNKIRQQNFTRSVQLLRQKSGQSLSDYIKFLQDIQSFFTIPNLPRKTLTHKNKL